MCLSSKKGKNNVSKKRGRTQIAYFKTCFDDNKQRRIMLHGRKVQERKTQDSFIGTKCFVKANNDISLGQRFMKSLNEFKIKR